ncbi:MFS transporter [Terasakiella sp. A23]|uniref:MFS transporter n=1 Tax=Terasakiella sp. FCG-A23 TaxID=3080561 RepID=UPI002954FA84|nr:MFS transporter [Terasakiella sp. A23]MDV7340078.1 MFS transporter [Terasakiella sp. A23]
MTHSPAAMVVRVFVPFAFGYFLSYLFRVVNAVIAPDLVADLGLGPDVLGLLTASYFLSFAAFQIPLGVLLDKYGPRLVEAGLLIFAAAGAALFAVAEDSLTLIAGRALIGFGVSACLMASFKAFTVFYEPGKLPLVNGFIMAAGGMGALAGTAPTELVVQEIGWRGGFWALAGLTIVCAVLVYLLVPPTKRPGHKTTLAEQMAGVKEVFVSSFFWRVAPITMASQATLISIQSLWVGPWHRDIAGLERGDVAGELSWIAGAMVAGFLGLGALSERLGRYGFKTVYVAGTGMFVFLLAQIGIIMEWAVDLPFLWIAFGFFGTTGILQYAVLSQHFPKELAGRVNTAINLMVFITIFVLQSLSGRIINMWEVTAAGGYDPEAYKAAFGFFLTLQVVTFIWFVWPRKKVE